jgi:hypothetical protein
VIVTATAVAIVELAISLSEHNKPEIDEGFRLRTWQGAVAFGSSIYIQKSSPGVFKVQKNITTDLFKADYQSYLANNSEKSTISQPVQKMTSMTNSSTKPDIGNCLCGCDCLCDCQCNC